MQKLATLVLMFAALGATARADVIYDFTYAPQSPFQNFSFTVDEPGFLTAGTYSIDASLTDGTTTWTFTKLVVGASGPNDFCFLLGTASLTPNGCGGFSGISGAASVELITSFFNPGGVPAATGSFSGANQTFFGFNASNGFTSTAGEATVNIATPEPASLSLIGIGLVAGGFLRRRRLAAPVA